MATDPNNHMELLNGVAVCQGCSTVKCTRVPHQQGFKIQVHHPRPETGGFGVSGTGEHHGNHHECGWNSLLDSCQCKCTNIAHTQTRPQTCLKSKNEYRSTSRYIDASHVLKYVERCLTCPSGTFALTNDAEGCESMPV